MVDASSSCFDLACASDNLAVEKPTYTLKWFRARGWKLALLGGYERRTDRIWAIVFVKRHCDLSVQREGEIENPPFCSVKTRVSATRRHGMVWGKHVMGSHCTIGNSPGVFADHRPTVSSPFALTASPDRKRFSIPLPTSILRFATSPQVDQTKWSANLSGFTEIVGRRPIYGASGPATLSPRSKICARCVNVRPSSKVICEYTAVVRPRR